MRLQTGNDVFESGCELMDVTSMHRPDTGWSVVDRHGHEHRWWSDGQPAGHYSPSKQYDVPSLIWVKDGEEFWDDDDEPHDVGHLECRICGEHIEPRYTADTTMQYAPGLRWFSINGQSVTAEEFAARTAHLR